MDVRRSSLCRVGLYVLFAVLACALLSTAALAKGKTVVTQWEYSADPNAIEVAKQMVQKFNSQSKDIEIRLEMVPRDIIRQKLISAIQAKNPPDLVRFDLPWTPEFAAMGSLEDLTDDVKGWKDFADFYPFRLQTVNYRGKIYGIPSNSNCLAIFYNKDLVREAGITAPPKDWAQLEDYARRLTRKKAGAIDVAGLLFGAKRNETIPFQFLPFVWQNGGSIEKMDSPEAVEALEFWMRLMDKGYTPRNVLDWGHTEMRTQFEVGKAAMMVNGTAYAAAIRKTAPDLKFGIWQMPKEKESASVIGGEDWVILKGAPSKEAAWEVLKFYSSKDIHEWWCAQTNSIPSRKSVGEASFFQNDPIVKEFVKQMEVARPRLVHPRYPEMSEAIQVAVQSALTKQASPYDALAQAAAKIKAILQ